MSHIIKNNDNIEMFIDDVNWIKKHSISEYIIKKILSQMLSNSGINHKVEKQIYDETYKSYYQDGVYYCPEKYKTIKVYWDGLNKLVLYYCECLKRFHNVIISNEIMAYVLLGIIAHEVEHAYQDFIGENKLLSPNLLISDAYKGLYDMIINENQDSLLLLKYFNNRDNLLLERNAQIESFDFVIQCAQHTNQKCIYNIYKEWIKGWLLLGYKTNNKGSIHETYNYLGLKDKYNGFNYEVDISEEEKIRYGLPIKDSTRERLLLK